MLFAIHAETENGPVQSSPAAALKVANPNDVATKLDLQMWQMRRFISIARLNYPDFLCRVLRAGDRPDFLVKRWNKRIGVDVAAASSSLQRTLNRKFQIVKARLRRSFDEGRLRKCTGLGFSLDFGCPDNKIPKVIKPNIFEELISGIEQVEYPRSGFPPVDSSEPWPFEATATSDGSISWYCTGDADRRNSDGFVEHCGFQVEHQLSTWISPKDLKLEFDRIVASHDKSADQGIDELILIAAGPDHDGLALPSEAAAADVFLSWGLRIEAPKFVKRVFLMNCFSQSISVLYPYP